MVMLELFKLDNIHTSYKDILFRTYIYAYKSYMGP